MGELFRSSTSGVRRSYLFTAAGGEGTISGADDNGHSLYYYDGSYTDVMLNGTKLIWKEDYTTPDGSTIDFQGFTLTAGDKVDVLAYDAFALADHYTKDELDTDFLNRNNDLARNGGTVAEEARVASVADLQAGSYPTLLERIWLSGYYGVGTPGGGPLYRDSADTTTADNGGTVFVDADGVRWKRNETSWALVEWWGAVADGSNVASEFNAALSASRRVTTHETGTFGFSSQVDIANADTVLDLGVSECRVLDSADITLFHVTGDRSGVMRGRIDGNRTNQPGNFKAMVYLEGASDSFAEGIRVVDSDGYGVHSKDSPRSRITNNTIIDSRYIGIYSLVKDLTQNIEGSIITGNTVDRRTFGETVVEGGIKVHQSGGSVGTYQEEGFIIEGNTVYQPNDAGAAQHECYVASGNRGRCANNYGFGATIGVTCIGDSVSCVGNIFESARDYGLEFTKLFGGVVTGNLVEGNGVTERGIAATSDATARNSHVSISGNTVRGCTDDPLFLRHCDQSTLQGNVFSGSSGSLFTDNPGLTVNGNVFSRTVVGTVVSFTEQEDFSFVGNTVENPGGGGIVFSSADGAFVPDNITIYGNTFDVDGSIIVNNLESGAYGEDVKVQGNVSPQQANKPEEFLDFKRNIVWRVRDGTPVGYFAFGLGSLSVDPTDGKLYIQTGASTSDWTVVGTQT